MAYKFATFGSVDNPEFDDMIEEGLNQHEASGWRVVNVHYYTSGVVKVLLHLEEGN